MQPFAATFEDAWARFQTLDSLRFVEDTVEGGLARGRAQLLAFVARVEDRDTRAYLGRIAAALDGIPGVEPYPDWYWHVTVKVAGFQVIKRSMEDDVLRQDVPRVAGRARALLAQQPAFDARLGPPGGFEEVVFVEVHDGGGVRALNTTLAEGIPEAARYPVDGEAFLPHVSIARFTSSDGLAQLKERLAGLRDERGPSFPVRRIEFVKAWLSEDVPEFDALATYRLRSGS